MQEMEYEASYQQALHYFELKDYEKAKFYFNITKESLTYRTLSLNALILIETYNSNYQKARNMLEEYKDELYFEYATTYANLEKVEFNLEKSLDMILDSFTSSLSPNKKLSYLADIYIELGEYERARKVLETIKMIPEYIMNANIKLIFLSIIEGDYLDAYKLFQKITINDMNSDFYNQLKAIIAYHRGRLMDIKDELNLYLYYIQRLFSNDDTDLIKHLKERHLKRYEGMEKSYFFNNIDLEKLITNAKDQIKDLNPSFDRNAFTYNLKFSKLIGFSNGVNTDSMKVVTALGTNKIITMYPIILSSEYNQEGLRESKELKLKRGLKWKN